MSAKTQHTKELKEQSNRLISLDAFRGFTVVAMILVNTPVTEDHVFSPLMHSSWNGVTPADYIFPFFIFIVGISITLSYSKLLSDSFTKKQIIKKAIKRTIIIFFLGIFLGLFPSFDFSEIRIPGVLQRIALVFFVCAFLYLYTNWKQQAWIGVTLLLLYWALMSWIVVPGIGAGVLEPGQNLAAWIDSLIIPGKMWQGTWDPEGVLSTLPAIATGISGMLIGKILNNVEFTKERKIIWIFSVGLLSFGLGTAWGWVFPLNKNLWTSSYVLYTSGLAAMIFAFLSFVIDELGYARWAKVGVVFGLNAITAYVIGGMLPALFEIIQDWYLQTFIYDSAWPQFVSLIWAISICLVCYTFVYLLYRKRVFIKV
jgi:predicted acyltransferase